MITAAFTRSYIACPLGIAWIGFIMMTYGATDAIFSYFFGRLAGFIGKDTARGFTIAFALGTDFVWCLGLLVWTPDPEDALLGAFPFFMFTIVYGMTDAVIQTQINAIYGAAFADNQDAAFGSYRMFESIGFIIVFVYDSLIQTSTKLFINMGVIAVSFGTFLLFENLQFKIERTQMNKGEKDPVIESSRHNKNGIDNDGFQEKQ